jgi:cytochrome c-type biogenesis protein CcmH/NrfG
MIAFGMLTFVWDRQVSVQMVIGGVALISIILTAYTASATFEDVKLYQQQNKRMNNARDETSRKEVDLRHYCCNCAPAN